ncbi:MAG: efflux RND transporter periplasmic adaptor subunit [Kofleriaceae bacterium]
MKPWHLIILLAAACRAPATKPLERDPTEAIRPAAPEAPAEIPEFVGVVTSRVSKVVSSGIDTARIERMYVRAGQRVRAGDPVAKLDETELQRRLEGAKASERAARSEVGAQAVTAKALAAKARNERMLARAGASANANVRNALAEAQAASANTGAAAGRLAVAQNQRKEIEQLLRDAQLRSPISGVVTMIKVKEGEMAMKGTPIARVFDDRDLMVRFAVPREYRASIARGQVVQLLVEGATRPVWARIQTISDELEPPVNFTVVEADIDDSKLAPDEIRVASNGRVRITGPAGGRQ